MLLGHDVCAGIETLTKTAWDHEEAAGQTELPWKKKKGAPVKNQRKKRKKKRRRKKRRGEQSLVCVCFPPHTPYT